MTVFLILLLVLLAVSTKSTVDTLLRKVGDLMSTFADVNAMLADVAAGVDRLEAAIADLKMQVAAGHVITQEELDTLGAHAASISADISDTSDQG